LAALRLDCAVGWGDNVANFKSRFAAGYDRMWWLADIASLVATSALVYHHRMQLILSRWWMWTLVNLAGIAAFLWLAVPTWIEPELANEPGANGGEGIVWATTALPVLLIFILLHFVFGLAVHRQRLQTGRWRGELLGSLTLLCWIAVIIFDNAHHGS
jgi:hypothetical protein